MTSRRGKPDPTNIAIGAYLRAERLDREWKQETVARALGRTKTSIYYYEHGTSRFPVVLFYEWCKLFDLDPGETLNRIYTAVNGRST